MDERLLVRGQCIERRQVRLRDAASLLKGCLVARVSSAAKVAVAASSRAI
ncbi:hypothetical protein [Candidatus Frankia nodulisporulans]|nr:hypothetical protein [Candidatus Frankia nodulisporulans]